MTTETSERAREFVERREMLLEELRVQPGGLEWCARHTGVVDDLVRSLYDWQAQSSEDMPRLAIVATGGYGRSELSPWSDVDLRLVPLDKAHPRLESTVKWLFRNLHEALSSTMGLKVGYGLSYVSDAAGFDAKTRSGLMDSRVVVGSQEAHDDLMVALWSGFPVAEFVIEKVREQAAIESRTNDTPYSSHPHLKSGAGGLRCFHTANWIGAAIGEGTESPTDAYGFVLLARNLLHLVAGRQLDHMTIPRRSEVAQLLGLEPLKFGSQLAEALSQNDAAYKAMMERLHRARFEL
ncbi:MAG TPA: hypothetical protein VNI20_00140, partial [Fimbriimonadaceae bacterium]|nr:hypothetical protein [Fimbriimonadaceae bacterium]